MGWLEEVGVGYSTYKAASENSDPAAKHPGFYWPQPQSWRLVCEAQPSLFSSFSFSGYAGSVEINTSQGHHRSRSRPCSKPEMEGSQHIEKEAATSYEVL